MDKPADQATADPIACGGRLPTPALRASVDNLHHFTLIVDDPIPSNTSLARSLDRPRSR